MGAGGWNSSKYNLFFQNTIQNQNYFLILLTTVFPSVCLIDHFGRDLFLTGKEAFHSMKHSTVSLEQQYLCVNCALGTFFTQD